MYLCFVGGGGGFGSVCGRHCSGFITYYYEAKYRLYGSLQLHLHPFSGQFPMHVKAVWKAIRFVICESKGKIINPSISLTL